MCTRCRAASKGPRRTSVPDVLGRRRATGGEHRLLEDIKKRFPKPGDFDAERLSRAAEFKVEFLRREPEPEPNVAPYWTKYQQVFSVAGLPNANPQDLKEICVRADGTARATDLVARRRLTRTCQ